MSNSKFGFNLNDYTADSVIHAPYIEANMTDALVVTVFPSVSATRKSEKRISWDALCEELEKVEVFKSKSEQRLIKLSSFGDNKTSSGAYRHDGNVMEVYGIEIDYDSVSDNPITFDDAVSRLQKAGLEAFVHTSYSHEPENGKHKWRALLPLSAPVKPAERLEYVERLNNLFNGEIDQGASFGISHSFYYGNNGKNYQCQRVKGGRIDIAGKNLKRLARKSLEVVKTVDEQGNDVHIPADERIHNAIAEIYGNKSYFAPALSLTGIFYTMGMSKSQSIAAVKAIMLAHPNPNDDINKYIAGVDKHLSTISREEATPKADVAVHKLGMDILEVSVPRHPFLIPDWLPLAAATLYAGNGGGGKSYTALEIGISLACGLNVLGYQTDPVSVVFLSGEDPYETVKWRAKQFIHSKKGEINLELLEKNFTVVDWTKEDQKIIFTMGGRGADGATFHAEAMDRLRNVIEANSPSLVIVDNDSNLFGGNEIDRSHVSNYVTGLVALAEMAAWLLLHHIDKGSAKSGIMDAFSGSTAWNNAVRARWSIGKLDSGKTGIKVFKNNYGRIGASAEIEFNQNTLCFDIGQSYFPSFNQVQRERTLTLWVSRVIDSAGTNGLRKSSKSKTGSVFHELKNLQSELGFGVNTSETDWIIAKMLGLGLLCEEEKTDPRTKTKVPFVLLTEEGLTQLREVEAEE